jgi:hypothetical protein
MHARNVGFCEIKHHDRLGALDSNETVAAVRQRDPGFRGAGVEHETALFGMVPLPCKTC